MFSWVPNGYVKYPCTHGIAGRSSVSKITDSCQHDIVFLTRSGGGGVLGNERSKRAGVCFVVRNILRMYRAGDGHVWVLATSKRHLDHLLCSFALGAELATAPGNVLQEWAANGQPVPDQSFAYK